MKNKEAKSIFSSLENYSSIPPPDLWDKIEVQLDQPKKKKRAIIWWSIAASLLVGLSVPTVLYFSSSQKNGLELNIENNSNGVVLQKGSNEKNGRSENENNGQNENDINGVGIKKDNLNNNEAATTAISNVFSTKSDSSKFQNLDQWRGNGMIQTITNQGQKSAIALNQNSTSDIQESELPINKSAQDNNPNSNKHSIVSNQSNDVLEVNKDKGIAEKSILKPELAISKSAQVTNPNSNKSSVVSNQSNDISEVNKNKGIAENSISNKSLIVNNQSTDISEVNKNKGIVKNSNSNKSSVVSNQRNNISKVDNNKGIAENSISKSKSVIDKSVQVYQSDPNSKSIATNKNSNVSTLNSNKGNTDYTKSNDSLSKIKLEVAQLEKSLVKLDEDKIKKKEVLENVDKWSVQVFAGVMSSQNYNNEKALGNTVDSKQSNGYGVKTNYKLNKKWAVSTGFKINELGQKIAGVSYYEQQSYSGMVVDKLPIAGDFYIPVYTPSSNNSELVSISNNEGYLFASNSNASNDGFAKGNVTQNLKYFEMPVEISYSLLSKKKANISMNTGGFVGKLISNDIALNGNSIGENKNVKDYVYGTLLSSTLQYEVFKKTNFFIEPGMNYYINPLENQSFNQFQWMFNFGLNVSF
jgi:hypothetical protein